MTDDEMVDYENALIGKPCVRVKIIACRACDACHYEKPCEKQGVIRLYSKKYGPYHQVSIKEKSGCKYTWWAEYIEVIRNEHD